MREGSTQDSFERLVGKREENFFRLGSNSCNRIDSVNTYRGDVVVLNQIMLISTIQGQIQSV